MSPLAPDELQLRAQRTRVRERLVAPYVLAADDDGAYARRDRLHKRGLPRPVLADEKGDRRAKLDLFKFLDERQAERKPFELLRGGLDAD